MNTFHLRAVRRVHTADKDGKPISFDQVVPLCSPDDDKMVTVKRLAKVTCKACQRLAAEHNVTE
jgi:hypothetical protein